MQKLPTGTVTLLFTDVEGSTRLLDELGADPYTEVLADHRRLLREAFTRHGGVEVDTQGDAFFVAFARASDAVAAAVEVQRSLDKHPIRVRIGLHTGEPTLTDAGYVGLDVHRAARIAACGHGGQTLLSHTTRDLLEPGTEVRDLGEHRLKDIAEPERIYQFGSAEFRPLRSLNQTNLPAQAHTLVDRRRELSDILALLRSETSRVVTLTGPGGTGKTRLALEAAAELVSDFADGVWLVDLAPVNDPDLVLSTIASTLATPEELVDYVRTRQTLLLLDNVEQVVAAAPRVAEILRSAPKLKLLATSRVPMHIAAELEYAVRSLSDDDAVVLFTERARARKPEFEPDASVVAICRRLDGLPLALELAAARVRILPPPQLLERLDKRLPLLTGGPRDTPERHRTLWATIEWSHDLLDDAEQTLFARLAIFAGGWTLEAAESICNADLDTLESLVDKSLVRERDGRFDMLETIREFALERLEAKGDVEALRRRHCDAFVALAEEAEPELTGPNQAHWLATLASEDANLRAALSWTIITHEDELALRLVGALPRYWSTRGGIGEGKAWAEAALASGRDQPPELRARALLAAGRLAWVRDEWLQARSSLEEAYDLFRRARSTSGLLQVLGELCSVYANLGDDESAKRLNSEGIELARAAGDTRRVGIFSALAGYRALLKRDFDGAIAPFEAALANFEACSDDSARGQALENLALIALQRGDSSRAADHVTEALGVGRKIDDRRLIAHALPIAAALVLNGRQADAAATLLRGGAGICRALDIALEAHEAEVAGETETRARQLLSESDFAAACEAGEGLSADGLVSLALQALH
jgi:predicted ATPase